MLRAAALLTETGAGDGHILRVSAVVYSPWIMDAASDVRFIAHAFDLVQMDRSSDHLTEAVQHPVALVSAFNHTQPPLDFKRHGSRMVKAYESPYTYVCMYV